jgi:hypothetical protein
LSEVVDAGVLLANLPSFDEVWNGNGRKETDDGHHDHNFDQREAGRFSRYSHTDLSNFAA